MYICIPNISGTWHVHIFTCIDSHNSGTLKGTTLDDIHDAVSEVLKVLLVCHVGGAVLQVSQVSLSQLGHQLLVPEQQETSRILFALWTESHYLDSCVHLRVELAVTLTLVPVFSVQHLAIGQSEVRIIVIY